MGKKVIFLGSDHAGFKIKEKLKKFLDKKSVNYVDLGPFEYDPEDDYPDYAFKLGERVSKENGMGILICGSGNGVVIAANKVKGIRAISATDEYTAKMGRLDGDSNVLGLSGRHTNFEKIKRIVLVWLKTEFKDAVRHRRRIEKIRKYELKK